MKMNFRFNQVAQFFGLQQLDNQILFEKIIIKFLWVSALSLLQNKTKHQDRYKLIESPHLIIWSLEKLLLHLMETIQQLLKKMETLSYVFLSVLKLFGKQIHQEKDRNLIESLYNKMVILSFMIKIVLLFGVHRLVEKEPNNIHFFLQSKGTYYCQMQQRNKYGHQIGNEL